MMHPYLTHMQATMAHEARLRDAADRRLARTGGSRRSRHGGRTGAFPGARWSGVTVLRRQQADVGGAATAREIRVTGACSC